MVNEGGTPRRQAEQSPQAGQDRQEKPPQPQGAAQVLRGLGISRHPRDGHGDEHRRRDDPRLHRCVAHHQAAQDGHGGPDGSGETQSRLLNDLEGQQHDQDLENGGKGDLLLGGHNGQGQLDRDGLRVKGDQGDIQPGQQDGERRAAVSDEPEGGGRHPVVGPVLAGFEELVQGARGQPAQGNAVGQQTHPALQQAPAEAVGALGIGHQGERGGQISGEIFLQVSRRLDPVDVQVRQAPVQAGHGVRVGDAVQPEDIHRGEGLPPHDVLPHLQLRGAETAADQRGVGPQALYKGVSGPLQGGFVFRLAHSALLLCGGGGQQRPGAAGEKDRAAAVDHTAHRPVQAGLHPNILIIEDRSRQPRRKVRILRRRAASQQGAEDIVIHPLRPGHPHNAAQHRLRPLLSPEPETPERKVRAVMENLGKPLQRQRAGQPRFPPGMRAPILFHKNRPLSGVVCPEGRRLCVKGLFLRDGGLVFDGATGIAGR